MTWSSIRPRAERVRAMTPNLGPTPAWSWDDLETTGPDAERASHEAERTGLEVEEAYRRGFVDGDEAGARLARDELQVAMHATLQVLEEVRANREAWDARLQEHLVVLAAAMAQKVVGRTREEDPTVFVELAQKAVATFPIEEALRIRLHPADQSVLSDGHFLDQVVGDRVVRWIADEDVVPGGCIVEGPDKIIDGRVDEALCRIVSVLTDG